MGDRASSRTPLILQLSPASGPYALRPEWPCQQPAPAAVYKLPRAWAEVVPISSRPHPALHLFFVISSLYSFPAAVSQIPHCSHSCKESQESSYSLSSFPCRCAVRDCPLFDRSVARSRTWELPSTSDKAHDTTGPRWRRNRSLSSTSSPLALWPACLKYVLLVPCRSQAQISAAIVSCLS